MYAEFDNQGDALTPATTETTATPPAVTYGGYQAGGFGASTYIPLDQSANIWATTGNQQIEELTTNPSLSLANTITATGAPTSTVVDGSGNIWALSSTAQVFNSTGTQVLSFTAPYIQPSDPVFDSNGNLWTVDNNSGGLYVDSSTGTQLADYPGTPQGFFGALPAVVGTTAADNAGNVYGCNANGTGQIVVYNLSTTTGSTKSYATAGGCKENAVLDGQANIWTVNTNS
jgi:hypothetical protein